MRACRALSRALVIGLAAAFAPGAGGASEPGDPIIIGSPDAPLTLALVANIDCRGCGRVMRLLFDTRTFEGRRLSPFADAIADGRLAISYRSVLPTRKAIYGAWLTRCAADPAEALVRLSSHPEGWGSFVDPISGEEVSLPFAGTLEVLGAALAPDLMAPDAIRACFTDNPDRQAIQDGAAAFAAKMSTVEAPTLFSGGRMHTTPREVERALAEALDVDLAESRAFAKRSSAYLARYAASLTSGAPIERLHGWAPIGPRIEP